MEGKRDHAGAGPRGPLAWMSAGTIVLGLVAALIVWFYGWGGHGEKSVDFGDVAPIESEPAVAGRPLLRVAVSAMTSPQAARVYYDDLFRLAAIRLGRELRFIQRRTYAEVNSMLKHGQVDVAFVCSGPYVTGHAEFGLELLAVPIIRGEAVYHSYIITPKGSPAKSFADLRGKRFAFTDPDSNTGHLVPSYMLARRGESVGSFFGSTFFTYSHDSSIRAVAGGRADGAAVDSLIYDFLAEIEPSLIARLKIVEKSPPYGIPPVVASPRLDGATKKRLAEFFQNLHKDEKGAGLLHRMRVDRFDAPDDRRYDGVRAMLKRTAR